MRDIEIKTIILIFLKNCEMNLSLFLKYEKIRYIYKKEIRVFTKRISIR